MDDNTIATSFATKRRKVLIKFRSMEEILSTYGSWFDEHGNLVSGGKHWSNRTEHLSPAYFRYLGKTVEMESHHSFPSWSIEREWDDLFATNMAMRVIASGSLTQEAMIELARKSILAGEIPVLKPFTETKTG